MTAGAMGVGQRRECLKRVAEVANMALAEVGHVQTVRVANGTVMYDPDLESHRASLLGALAAFGPDKKCFCFKCASSRRHELCITVADAVRGRSCEAWEADR